MTETKRDENAKAKREYAKGLLTTEPSMSNADLNYLLGKSKFGGGMSPGDIAEVRRELGWEFQGRKLIRIGEGDKKAPQTTQALTTTTESPPAKPTPPQAPPVTTATTAVRTPPLSAQSEADKVADDHLMADLVARLQQVMEREGIVYLEVPRRGQVKIHQTQVVMRTLTPVEVAAAQAAH